MVRIVATGLATTALFFATLDARDRLTWTDQPAHALTFETPAEAERFAETWIDTDTWRLEPA